MTTIQQKLTQKPKVQVFACPEIAYQRPKKRSRVEDSFMSSKVSEIHRTTNSGEFVSNKRGKQVELSRKEEVEKQFRDTFESVRELGISNFNSRDKKKFEKNKLVTLGARPDKEKRIPYHILIGINKGAEKREKRKTLYDRSAGVVSVKSKSANQKKSKKPYDKGLHVARGHFKNGVLNVKKFL